MSKFFMKLTKNVSIFLSVLFLAAGTFSSSSFASVEAVKDQANGFLDGIENAVKGTGLPDLKKRVFEKYGLLIKPYYKQGYEINSNVFSAPDTDSDHTDSIWTFTPGIQGTYQHQYGVVGLAYEATFRYLNQFNKQNGQDQTMLVYSDLFPSEDTYFRVSEKLDSQSPYAGSSALEPVDFIDNTVNVVAGYHMDENWTHEVGYENYNKHLQQDIKDRFNYNENKYDYRLYRKLNEKVRGFVGGRLGFVDFKNMPSRSTFYFETPVGIEGTLPYGIVTSAAVGFHHRNLYDSNRNNWTNVVTSLNAQKTFNEGKTSVEGSFIRRPVESTFENTTTYDEKTWYLGFKHLITETVRGRLSSYGSNRDCYESSFAGLRLQIGGNRFVVLNNVVKRDDDIFGMNVGFDLRVRKWLIFNVDYNLTRRDSNISQLDYTENRFLLGTTVPL